MSLEAKKLEELRRMRAGLEKENELERQKLDQRAKAIDQIDEQLRLREQEFEKRRYDELRRRVEYSFDLAIKHLPWWSRTPAKVGALAAKYRAMIDTWVSSSVSSIVSKIAELDTPRVSVHTTGRDIMEAVKSASHDPREVTDHISGGRVIEKLEGGQNANQYPEMPAQKF